MLKTVMRPRSKVVTFTKNLADASGTQAITGVGFKPEALLFIYFINATNVFGVGMSDGTQHGRSCTRDNNTADTWSGTTTQAIAVITPTSADAQSAVVSSKDADGFTLTWTKVGSPSGTLTILCLASE